MIARRWELTSSYALSNSAVAQRPGQVGAHSLGQGLLCARRANGCLLDERLRFGGKHSIHCHSGGGDVATNMIDTVPLGIVNVYCEGADISVSAGRECYLLANVDNVRECSAGGIIAERIMVQFERQESGLPPHTHTEIPRVGGMPARVEEFGSIAMPFVESPID